MVARNYAQKRRELATIGRPQAAVRSAARAEGRAFPSQTPPPDQGGSRSGPLRASWPNLAGLWTDWTRPPGRLDAAGANSGGQDDRYALLAGRGRRPHAAEPHRRGAHVPVFGRRRFGDRLAPPALDEPRDVRCRDDHRRDDRCGAPRADNPWLHGALLGPQRSCGKARASGGAGGGGAGGVFRRATRPCRTQGLVSAAVGRWRTAWAGRGSVADDLGVGRGVRQRLAHAAGARRQARSRR